MYHLKGLLKGFWWPFILSKLVKYSQSYGLNEVCDTEKVKVTVEGVDLLEKVKQSKMKDDKVIKTVEEMKQARVKMLRDEEWKEVDNIIYKEKKVYIPRDKKLRAEII